MLGLLSHLFATIDFSVVGGVLLLVDLILFAVLAAFWEQAGRMRLLPPKKGDLPGRR